MKNYWETMRKKFDEERDDVLLTFDLEKIKKFYKKYRDLLAFPFLPPENIIYRDSMKDILKMDKATPEQKQRAKEWLDNQKRKENSFEIL